MKFMHLSDLHLGKRLNEFSLIEDQEYILKEIIGIARQERVDAIIVAGDVYDKSVPSAEAISLFDDFLYQVAASGIKAFVISGNHDSSERIAFGGRLMGASGVFMSPIYSGSVSPVTLEDEFGKVNVYLLPFIKPANVRQFLGGEISSYNQALKAVMDGITLCDSERNVLVTHQFVTGAIRCESEEVSVGGTDNVDANLFEKFDYVALGHIHSPQSCVYDKVRYCGTPLKYSFSEAKDVKSVTIVELKQKGNVDISTIPLTPLRDMVEIRGKYSEVMLKAFYENTSWQTDYVHVTLTDEEDVPDAISKLKSVYRGLMKLDYDNTRTRQNQQINGDNEVEKKSPFELFSEFYAMQNNQELSGEQTALIKGLIEEIWEGEK